VGLEYINLSFSQKFASNDANNLCHRIDFVIQEHTNSATQQCINKKLQTTKEIYYELDMCKKLELSEDGNELI